MNSGGARKGAGRKRKYGEETIRLLVTMPVGLQKKLQKHADKQGMSQSEIAILAIAKEVGYKISRHQPE